jgi:hypothetical protein
MGNTADTVCTRAEKPLELFVSIGESFFGYACCASLAAVVLLLPAMFGAHTRSTVAATKTASACLVVTTAAMAALCYTTLLAVQAMIS